MCVYDLRLLVVFVPSTSSTPLATWFWQTEGRSAECVILGVRPSKFILLEFQYPSRRIFIGSHSPPPPLWSPNRSFSLFTRHCAGVVGDVGDVKERRGPSVASP
jgi:hypothetical protein